MAKDGKFPNGLQVAMTKAGVGPAELARAIGENRQNVTRWAKGQQKLTAPRAERIAPHLGVTAEELIFERPPARGVQRVPLLSWVAAGRLVTQEGVRNVDIRKKVMVADLPKGEWVALEVEGNSMDRIAPEGAIIFVNRQDDALKDDGFYVFTLEDGSTTFKRYKAGKQARLQPFSTNPDHETIYPSEGMKVVGRVKRSVLDL